MRSGGARTLTVRPSSSITARTAGGAARAAVSAAQAATAAASRAVRERVRVTGEILRRAIMTHMNRTTFAALALVAACAALAHRLEALETASEFRADAHHSGLYPGAGLATHGLKWKFHAGGAIVSTPAVADGTVYFGSSDHRLYALDTRSGAQRWSFETGSRVASSPAVSGGRVYFGSYDGNFYAVDAASGKLVWKFATQGERRFAARHLHGALPAAEVMPDPFDVFLSSPALGAALVYFGSGDGNVYALEIATGKLRWSFHTGNVVHASPALAHGLVYVGSWDSYFYALDAATGTQRWRFKTGEDPQINNQIGIQSSAVVAGDTVYFGCRDSNLYALDAASGAKRWAFSNKGSWVIGSPSVRDGKVYFATSDSGLVQVLDARSGAAVFSLSFNRWPMFSSPALAGHYLYIGSHMGKLLAIDLEQRAAAWSFVTDGARANAAALTKADGSPNYEAAFADFFYDDLVTGTARMLSVGAVLSSPVIAADTLYFGSTDGNLYAIG
jgi:outer membrane protein assembly factor BamB